jgi:hypothetical protein
MLIGTIHRESSCQVNGGAAMSTMNESGGEFKAKQLLENAQEMIDFVQRACHRGEAVPRLRLVCFVSSWRWGTN